MPPCEEQRAAVAGCSAARALPGANVERPKCLPEQRHAVKIFFLGIFPKESQRGISAINQLVSSKSWRGLAVTEKRTKNSGVMVVAFAAVAVWQIYDVATATETPGRSLAILQYVLLGGLLVGLAGALLNFLRSQ